MHSVCQVRRRGGNKFPDSLTPGTAFVLRVVSLNFKTVKQIEKASGPSIKCQRSPSSCSRCLATTMAPPTGRSSWSSVMDILGSHTPPPQNKKKKTSWKPRCRWDYSDGMTIQIRLSTHLLSDSLIQGDVMGMKCEVGKIFSKANYFSGSYGLWWYGRVQPAPLEFTRNLTEVLWWSRREELHAVKHAAVSYVVR